MISKNLPIQAKTDIKRSEHISALYYNLDSYKRSCQHIFSKKKGQQTSFTKLETKCIPLQTQVYNVSFIFSAG